MTLYLLAGAVAGFVLAIILVARDILERRRAFWEQRLQITEDETEGNTLARLAARPGPRTWAERMDHAFSLMIRRTGLNLSPEQAVGIMVLFGVMVATGLVLYRDNYWFIALGLVLGMLMPLIYFLFMQTRWRRRLQEQLPDAFFLLARSMRAGLSLEQAVALVGEQGVKPLADEFHKASEQTRLGLNITAALQRMAENIRLTDLNIFVSVVTLHRQVGGNLALLLDRVAAHTRDRNLFRGQFQAATALGRATGIFISAASPVLLLVYGVLQPNYLIKFAQNPSGLMALGVAALLQIVGALWIFYLLRVDY
jgi:tight adherence protein B